MEGVLVEGMSVCASDFDVLFNKYGAIQDVRYAEHSS